MLNRDWWIEHQNLEIMDEVLGEKEWRRYTSVSYGRYDGEAVRVRCETAMTR